MMSIRHGTGDYRLPEQELPFLYRAVDVTRRMIHSDVEIYNTLIPFFRYHDDQAYGSGELPKPEGLGFSRTSPAAPSLGKKILWRVKRMLRSGR